MNVTTIKQLNLVMTIVLLSCNAEQKHENNSPENSANNNSIPTTKSQKVEPAMLEYEGDAKDEVGNRAHYILRIKPDFSAASISSNPFNRLEKLPNGMFQWMEGSVIGIKIQPTQSSCSLYNMDGSFFCLLKRIK